MRLMIAVECEHIPATCLKKEKNFATIHKNRVSH